MTAPRTARDYELGERVTIAPQWSAGPYVGHPGTYDGEPFARYAAGPSGSSPYDLRIALTRDAALHGEWEGVIHLQRVVGSGLCHWEQAQKRTR